MTAGTPTWLALPVAGASQLLELLNDTSAVNALPVPCALEAVEYLAELVKNKRFDRIAVINHLFSELKQDYAFYCHEENDDGELAESILGAVFLYFDKVELTQDEWTEIIHTGDEKKDDSTIWV